MPGESPISMMRPPPQRVRKLPAGRARRRRWPILAPAAIVVVLAVGWVWLWYYAASVADRTLSGWVEREAAAGRIYSCGSQSIGGFPFRIQARCATVAAEIKNYQPPFAVQAQAVTFAAEVFYPTRLVGDITGPLTLADFGQPPHLAADWMRARVVVRGVPPDPEAVSIDLEAPHVDRIGGRGDAMFKAKRADLQTRIAAGSPRDHPVIEVTLHLSGATAPTFHPLLAEPIEAELDAVIRGFKDLSPKPWADRFREMQAAGGGIEIKSLRIAQTNAIVVGAGTLSVNAHGKLDGLVRVAIAGVEHIVPLLGIDRMIGQGIDQLSGGDGALDRLIPGLSGALRQTASASMIENFKKMGEPTTIENRPATILPLRFSDGAIYLGMLRVGEAPPLF
jgi:hypothetical protein